MIRLMERVVPCVREWSAAAIAHADGSGENSYTCDDELQRRLLSIGES